MIVQGLLVALAYIICVIADRFTGLQLFNRPLIMSLAVGIVLGDIESGLVMGAALEAVYLGVIAVGGAVPTDTGMGSCMGTAFAILTGADVEMALAMSAPLGLLGNVLNNNLVRNLKTFFEPLIDRWALEGKERNISIVHWFNGLSTPIIPGIVIFAAVAIGAEQTQRAIESFSQTLLDGLGAGASMLPAVGFALLINMLWTRRRAIYFFLGFAMTIYLELPTLAIAIFSIIIAIATFMTDKDFHDLREYFKSKSAEKSVEEDFFA